MEKIIVFKLVPRTNSASYIEDEEELKERIEKRLYLIADEVGYYLEEYEIKESE